MAEVKRYYWLKLDKDFFKSKRIKKLRKLAGGDTYTIIYLKMQLLSLTTDGVLEYTGLEGSFAEEIALDIDEDTPNVEVTINYLLSCGLLIEDTNNEYSLPFVKESIGSETASAQRVRKHRALQCNTPVTQVKQICNVEIDIEKEKDIEIDKPKKTYVSVINSFTEDIQLRTALYNFKDMRQKQKGFTISALELNLEKLKGMSSDDGEKAEIVKQSVMNGWKSFYELKKDTKVKRMPNYTSEEVIEDDFSGLQDRLKNRG